MGLQRKLLTRSGNSLERKWTIGGCMVRAVKERRASIVRLMFDHYQAPQSVMHLTSDPEH